VSVSAPSRCHGKRSSDGGVVQEAELTMFLSRWPVLPLAPSEHAYQAAQDAPGEAITVGGNRTGRPALARW
jgi:hypothetical protein